MSEVPRELSGGDEPRFASRAPLTLRSFLCHTNYEYSPTERTFGRYVSFRFGLYNFKSPLFATMKGWFTDTYQVP
jgi:hypothetical protein